MKLKNKIALITGSSSGIGQATAELFAKHGATVIVHYNKNYEGAKETQNNINKEGGTSIIIQADVSQEKDVYEMFQTINTQYNGLDILINNAGITRNNPFLQSTYADWIQEFNDNFFGAVLCSQQAVKIMQKKSSGIILNTSSVRGILHTGRESIMPYSTAKAALNSFTTTLAKELAPNIRVNAVAPGFTYTHNYEKLPKELTESFINSTCTKRFIHVKEIAEALLYLATAPSVTGEILVVDGGFTLKKG